MALSASLFLRQNQSLVMTPQLMQSIQLLQMPYMELNQFIAGELEKNPLLELENNDDHQPHSDDTDRNNDNSDDARSGEDKSPASDWYSEETTNGNQTELNEQLDSNYSAAFSDDMSGDTGSAPALLSQRQSIFSGGSGNDYSDLDEFIATRPCLRDHLTDQIALTFRSSRDQLIAAHLVDYLDEAGYFRGEATEIAQRTGVDVSAITHVLNTLKTLDPPGVFAQSLKECLRQQLIQNNRHDPAMAALTDHLDLVARRDFTRLKKLCGVNEEDLLDMMKELRTLNPKPGSAFNAQPPESVLPDVIVRKGKDGNWQIELNADTLPRVLINRTYLTSLKSAKEVSDADQAFMNTCLQNANWLTRSLDQRARTILKVATEITRQQDAFLNHGVDHLRPLNLKTVADAIKMHESTVSRVTSNKFMLTPLGLFEMKYFFTVSIAASNTGGDTHSAEAVRHKIRNLISTESAQAVLSDDDIVAALKRDGIVLARRTVAKYREAMNLPSSVQRRREKRAVARVAAGI